MYQKSQPVVWFCETGRFEFQNGTSCSLKRHVLEAKTTRFATPLIINDLQACFALRGAYQKLRSCFDFIDCRIELDFWGIFVRLQRSIFRFAQQHVRAMWRSKRANMTQNALNTAGIKDIFDKIKTASKFCVLPRVMMGYAVLPYNYNSDCPHSAKCRELEGVSWSYHSLCSLMELADNTH